MHAALREISHALRIPKAYRLFILLALTFAFPAAAAAAAGDVDPTFDPGLSITRRALVDALAVQPDGKLLVAGNFQIVNGVTRGGVFRLNADGSLDSSFALQGSGFNRTVNVVALQPDGKILVGGVFTSYNGIPRGGVARLNADGSLDASFKAAGVGTDGAVYSLALAPDGKVVIGGLFTGVNGAARVNVARLNADGSTDTTFAPPVPDDAVTAVALQADGKVLLGGLFTNAGGTPRGRVARLNADGSLDTSFLNAGSGADLDVLALALQPDGKVLVGGVFASFNGAPRNGVARLNGDGSLDTTFNPGSGTLPTIYTLALQPDGKVLMGGFFSNFGGQTRHGIARLNTDGTVDTSFQSSGAGTNSNVYAVQPLADGRVYVGGLFRVFNGSAVECLVRLDASGNTDTSFAPALTLLLGGQVETLALQPDGKILVGGTFSAGGAGTTSDFVRFNSDGSLDATFSGNVSVNNTVKAVAVQPDGKILVGGLFTFLNGANRGRIARLNSDGTLDTTFPANPNFNTGFNGAVQALALQPDGKIVVVGSFTSVNGLSRLAIVRLNADGSLDFGFVSPVFAPNLTAVALQPDGKVLIGGSLSTSAGGRGVARLNADGSLDSTFNANVNGTSITVSRIVQQPDGKILVGGKFDGVNGVARPNLVRLNTDGTLDASFDAGAPAAATVYGLALQSDGAILVGGTFNTFGGVARNNLARLKSNGSPDETFLNFGAGPNNAVRAVAVQPDGRVLFGGDFSTVNGVLRAGVARLTVGLSPNPIDVPVNFVTQHYRDFLSREPDADGLRFWTDQMANCSNPPPSDLLVCRVNVSAAFFLSIEFQQTGNLVYKMYKASFGNVAGTPVAVRRASFLADTRQIASTPAQVIVGQVGWEQQLETNKQAFALAFVQRAAFQAAHAGQDANAFVDSLFANVGVTPTTAERNAALGAYGAGGVSGQAAALRSVAENASVSAKTVNESFVLMQYFGYLQRDPDAAPDSDFSGYNFWLNKLNDFHGNYVEAEMVKGFITSIEYRQRFGTP